MTKLPGSYGSTAFAAAVMAIAMLWSTLGCDRVSKESTNGNDVTEKGLQKETVLKAVTQYYADRGSTVPPRIVIIRRGEKSWTVHVGPEIKEAEFEVDPQTGRIIQFKPGE